MPTLTLEALPRRLALIQRHAAAANAPSSATVRFEDQVVRPRGDEATQVVHVTWHIELED